MTWIAYTVFAFLLLRMMVSIINLITSQWLKTFTGSLYNNIVRVIPAGDADDDPGNGQMQQFPLISVLIPARNEGRNIGSLLEGLINQDYPNCEILVYDDLSTDNTPEVVAGYMKKTGSVRLLKGASLPQGWLGKNNACHRLALEAKGDYLLFIDADVKVEPPLVSNALGHMKKYDLDLLSIFPRQIMKSVGEKIVVPLMNIILVGLLPLILTRISKWTSFSAANGQFMLFRAPVYRMHQFHKKLREVIVEDIEIFRLMKKKSLRTHTLLSNGDISCRMYGSWRESVAGLSRSLIGFFGGNPFLTLLYTLITTLGFIPVILYLPLYHTVLFFIMGSLHISVISMLSRQPVHINLLFTPLRQISLSVMTGYALFSRTSKRLIWKGRNIYAEKSGTGPKSFVKSAFTLMVLLSLNLIPHWLHSATGGEKDPVQMIYRAYVDEKIYLWQEAVEILETDYRRTGSIVKLYDLTLARYGYIGYSLGIGNKSEGRDQISLAEADIEKLILSEEYRASAYALQAALYAYRISLSPWRAVFWGQKSMNLIQKAMETDPKNPSGWIEHGNAMFYAPSMLGGSKQEAVKSYSQAIRLLESDMKKNHRWLYLNTLVGLAKSYHETGNTTMARITYIKALEFEPGFKWVKEKLLPGLEKDR